MSGIVSGGQDIVFGGLELQAALGSGCSEVGNGSGGGELV
jgi:hypothetical protein